MENKVLIKLIFPEIDSSFDFFIPVNETIFKVKKLLLKIIGEINNNDLEDLTKYYLINKITSKIYKNNEIVINTDIRNGTELLLIKKLM